MIAVTIGRTFLDAYNEKFEKQMTAKQFFEEVYFPLFYGNPKYLQWITNSPFVQGLSADPKGEYGLRDTVKDTNGKTMTFKSDSDAVKYFKDNILNRQDFLYCKLPKFTITQKGIDYLQNINDVSKLRNILIDADFCFENNCTTNEIGHLQISELAINSLKNKVFNSRLEATRFYAEEFVATKGHFKLSDKDSVSEKGIKFLKTLNETERQLILDTFTAKLENVVENRSLDGCIAIGFPASEVKEFNVASGQVSDINLQYSEDDVYYSWIGSGLSIGVKGGLTIFFNEKNILLDLFEGWKIYRDIISDKIINIVGKQIPTWNGQWIAFKNSKYSILNYDFSTFKQYGFFKEEKNEIKVDTIHWSKVLFELSNNYSEVQMTGYVFNYGDQNSTYGFFPFYFESARTIKKYYQKLFGKNNAINNANDYGALFGLDMKVACRFGSFGLQALEPSSLRDKYGNFKNLKLIKPKIVQKNGEESNAFEERKKKAFEKDYENIIYYQTYKTWLLAMITKNKEENLLYSEEVAKALLAYSTDARVEKKFVEDRLLDAKGRKKFITDLSELIKNSSEKQLKTFKDLRDRVYLLNDEDFQYLFILIKFDFAYQKRLQNQ